jgi:hypothetical protein
MTQVLSFSKVIAYNSLLITTMVKKGHSKAITLPSSLICGTLFTTAF